MVPTVHQISNTELMLTDDDFNHRTGVMQENVLMFRKHTWKYLEVKGPQV